MQYLNIINIMISKIKGFFSIFFQEQKTEELNAHLAEEFTSTMKESLCEAGKAGFKEFIETYDETKETINHEGIELRCKIESEKRFISPFGEIKIKRILYQSDRGGKSYIPLDAKWGMEDEFTAPEVRDATLYGSALMSPSEVASMLQKCSFFNPSTTAIQNMVNKTGELIEANQEELSDGIFSQEEVPGK